MLFGDADGVAVTTTAGVIIVTIRIVTSVGNGTTT